MRCGLTLGTSSSLGSGTTSREGQNLELIPQGCLAPTQQKEVLLALYAEEGPPLPGQPRRRSVGIDETTTFTCARCKASTKCFVCHEERVESVQDKATAVREEKATAVQNEKNLSAEAEGGVQHNVEETREGAGAQTRGLAEEEQVEHVEQAEQAEQAEVSLLFRCVRCKQAAHYEHRKSLSI